MQQHSFVGFMVDVQRIFKAGFSSRRERASFIFLGDIVSPWDVFSSLVFDLGWRPTAGGDTGGTIGISKRPYYRMILQDAIDEFLKTPEEFPKALKLSFWGASVLPHEFFKAIKKLKMF